MRKSVFLLLAALPAWAAVTGTVVNRTTGQPEAGAVVRLYKFGQNGMEPVDQAKTDAQGQFTIPRDAQGPGPAMLRTELDGVTYNHMIPPGTPSTGLAVDVYRASRQPGAAKVSKHMLLFEPSGTGQMIVNETYLYENPGKTTWSDPAAGTLHFYLPAAAKGVVDVKASAPDGMPIPAPTDHTSHPNIETVKFEVKPGETRFDIAYTVPYTEGQAYEGKIATDDQNTYLIAPNGVTMQGTGLEDLGAEPRTQSHIYGFKGTAYKITLTGTEAAPPADNAAADNGGGDDSGPQIEQIMPRLYSHSGLIVGLALGILALGFAVLYRAADSRQKAGLGKDPGRGEG